MGRILLLILIPLMYYCAIKSMNDWKNYENLLTNLSRGSIIIIEREVMKMTVEELKAKRTRRKEWLGDEVTEMARNKLFLGVALTQLESEKLFNYLRKLENSLDIILDKWYNNNRKRGKENESLY